MTGDPHISRNAGVHIHMKVYNICSKGMVLLIYSRYERSGIVNSRCRCSFNLLCRTQRRLYTSLIFV